MGSFYEAVRAGQSIADVGIDSFNKARSYRDATAAREAKAAYTASRDRKEDFEKGVADDRAQGAQSLAMQRDASAEKHARKQDDLIDEEIASMKAGRGKSGTASGNRASPALIALRDQYKQVSGDVRSKTLTGMAPPADMVKRYNAIGKALNAQTKHEDPSSVSVDFVPMPEAEAPHPAASWINKLSLGTLDKPAAPMVGAEDWKQFDK